MIERPILFGAEMVQAILRGDKTQTRRVVKYNSDCGEPRGWCSDLNKVNRNCGDYRQYCPYGKAGDRLWVREGYSISFVSGISPCVSGAYSADDTPFDYINLPPSSWAKFMARKYKYRGQPGRFMYRALSRITLEITDVHLERVQAITSADIIAEGIAPLTRIDGHERDKADDELRFEFMALWDKINGGREGGEYSFYKNPWVWVVEFKRVEEGDKQ